MAEKQDGKQIPALAGIRCVEMPVFYLILFGLNKLI